MPVWIPRKLIIWVADESVGQINVHKSQTPRRHKTRTTEHWSQSREDYRQQPNSSGWRAPDGERRPRAKGRDLGHHRNRTLVMNGQANVTRTPKSEQDSAAPLSHNIGATTNEDIKFRSSEVAQYVTKQDRHMQLINSSIFDKETQNRNSAIEQTRRRKALHKDQRQRQRVQMHLQKLPGAQSKASQSHSSSANFKVHELAVGNLRFEVCNGGSKLKKLSGGCNMLLSLTRLTYRRGQCSKSNNSEDGPYWRSLVYP